MASIENKHRKQIEEVRQQIRDVRAERDSLASAMLTRDEIEESLARWIAGQAEKVERQARVAASEAARPGGRIPVDESGPMTLPGIARGGVNLTNFAPFMCAMFPDHVRDFFLKHLPDDSEGIPRRDRPGRLRELDAKIRELEAEEERLVVDAEASGVEVLRRPDADPEIVLGVEWPRGHERAVEA